MRGGKRTGAGRPPVPTGNPTLKNWTVRVHEHEKKLVKEYLKKLRSVEK
jgi:hypothetical protein